MCVGWGLGLSALKGLSRANRRWGWIGERIGRLVVGHDLREAVILRAHLQGGGSGLVEGYFLHKPHAAVGQLNRLTQKLNRRLDILPGLNVLKAAGHAAGLFQRGKLSHLRDKIRVGLGIHRILILHLHGQQFQEVILAQDLGHGTLRRCVGLGRLSGCSGGDVGWDHVGMVALFRPTTAERLAVLRQISWTHRVTPKNPCERIRQVRVPDHSTNEDPNRRDRKSP